MTAFFDFGDAGAFFQSIERRWDAYLQGTVRSTEDLLYVIFGLNHLREWIAPGLMKGGDGRWLAVDTPAKRFSKEVSESGDFDVVRKLANGIKHAKHMSTGYVGGAFIDDWPDFDAVTDFDTGPPTGYDVNGQPVEDFIVPIMEAYRNWFSTATESGLS